MDVAISYGHARERPGVEVLPMGKESIVPLCSPSLRDAKTPVKKQIGQLTLIESQLSQVTWRDWFALNELAMPVRARPSFDRAALAISAAVDGMGVALESTRFAERELARGELIELGPTVFRQLSRVNHFFSQRVNERHVEKVKSFKNWVFKQLATRGRRADAKGS